MPKGFQKPINTFISLSYTSDSSKFLLSKPTNLQLRITYFSNKDDFLWVFLNDNFHLYKIFCCRPSFVAHNIHLEIKQSEGGED